MIPDFTDQTSPKAPFDAGKTPRAAWYCIEVTFRHESPNPEALSKAMGQPVKYEVATPETLARLADVFQREQAGGRGLLVTRDHASFFDDPDTRATGWIRALHADGDKLWAWIEWTPYGHAMVDGGEFIHFSTEYAYDDFSVTGEGAEPGRLHACTITNEPRHQGQTPCTNSKHTHTMKTKPAINRTNRTARNSGADDTITNSEEPKAADAANSDVEESAANAGDDDTPATNSDDDPTAANGDEAAPGGVTSLEDAVQQAAALLGLPETATPADFLAAVKQQVDSVAELNAALEEASTTNSNAACRNSGVRFPGLVARNASTRKLSGNLPNRAVSVTVGNASRAVNTQDKALVDFCRNAVSRREKELGRPLSPTEYANTHAAARRDFRTRNGI